MRSRSISVDPRSTVEQWDGVGRGEGEVVEEVWVGKEWKVLSPPLTFSGPQSAVEDLCHWCCVHKERPAEALDVSCRSTSVSVSRAELLQPRFRRSVTLMWMTPLGSLFPLVAVVTAGFPVVVGHAHGVLRLKSYDSPPARI